jgi:hypothetical protein
MNYSSDIFDCDNIGTLKTLWNKWFWFTGWNTVYFYLEISMAQLYYGLWRPWYSMILWIVTTLVHNDIMDCDDFGTQWYHGMWRPWYSMMSWIVTTLVLNDIMDCDDFGTQWCHGLYLKCKNGSTIICFLGVLPLNMGISRKDKMDSYIVG